ncbi:hypothetical protein HMPREF1319_0575 [Capnocytophaga ochracea str. Holt 25]|nr:hypothetical protein HMPREF1319_0575 [Capnocytophaga ochracea str. Holt 25]
MKILLEKKKRGLLAFIYTFKKPLVWLKYYINKRKAHA